LLERLTGFKDLVVLEYQSSTTSLDREEFLQTLESLELREIASNKNLLGPHRDDFVLKKNKELNIYNSSRGELRAQILALKLLQAEYLSEGEVKPVILLDDVFSELDETRRTKLMENLQGHQIFITSTEEHHLPKLDKDALILHVENNEMK
jgi:DNA replication and repair protein RecF